MSNPILKTFDYSFLSFLKHRVNGGMVLMVVAVLAMIVANSPWAETYHAFWNHPVSLQVGGFNLFSHHGEPLTLMAFINDALMAVFFFSVGLEIKREVLVGELSSLRQALLPIIAAVGGMIIPVAIYFAMTSGTPAEGGLAIPMATDIAFSLGVLSLFGKRVPLSLKIFLTAFAVVGHCLLLYFPFGWRIFASRIYHSCYPTDSQPNASYVAHVLLCVGHCGMVSLPPIGRTCYNCRGTSGFYNSFHSVFECKEIHYAHP